MQAIIPEILHLRRNEISGSSDGFHEVLNAHNLVLRGIFVLIFCFMGLVIGNPRPKNKPPLECPRILLWTANNSSAHHFKIPLQLALIFNKRLIAPLRYCIIFTNLAQLYLSGARTLVVINAMAVKISDLALLVAYKVLSARLWNSTTF